MRLESESARSDRRAGKAQKNGPRGTPGRVDTHCRRGKNVCKDQEEKVSHLLRISADCDETHLKLHSSAVGHRLPSMKYEHGRAASAADNRDSRIQHRGRDARQRDGRHSHRQFGGRGRPSRLTYGTGRAARSGSKGRIRSSSELPFAAGRGPGEGCREDLLSSRLTDEEAGCVSRAALSSSLLRLRSCSSSALRSPDPRDV